MPGDFPSLPVISPAGLPSLPRSLPSRRRSLAVHLVRLMIVGLLGATLYYADQRRRSAQHRGPADVQALPTDRLTEWFGETAVSQRRDADQPTRIVRDAKEQALGRLVQTLPASLDITGYRGPSNLLLGIAADQQILGVRLLDSQDTPDHVEAIRQSPEFFRQFVGRTSQTIYQDIDVVSGATLTSLAIRDSIAHRLGVTLPMSTRFPASLTLEEARRLFPDADAVASIEGAAGESSVRSADGAVLGTITRSGVLSDDIHGYQGPTELLIAMDPRSRLQAVHVRQSFDNQPYVSYLDDEPWFWDPFRGRNWQQLAAADLQQLGVEGVSGATMTSVAAAETLVAAAQQRELQQTPAATAMEDSQGDSARQRRGTVRWSLKEYATLAILLGSVVLAWSPLGGSRRLRIVWQWMLVIGLGLLTGNLLSIALLMGWSSSGVAWRLAPGLSVVLGASLLLAATSKSPFYCAQLCPHGALQQRLRNALPARWRWHPVGRARMLSAALLQIPLLLLVAAYWVTLTGMQSDLARWEPFDAYLWWAGAGGSLLLAMFSIGISLLSPMAYCRYGCPTGRFLAYIRWHRRAGIWGRGDWLAVGLLLAAWIWLAQKNSG